MHQPQSNFERRPQLETRERKIKPKIEAVSQPPGRIRFKKAKM